MTPLPAENDGLGIGGGILGISGGAGGAGDLGWGSGAGDTWPGAGKLVPTVLTWRGGGEAVEVEGSWDGWRSRARLARAGRDWTLVKNLPPGVHRYRFVVDGELRHDPSLPCGRDEAAGSSWTNAVEVHLYEPENLASLRGFDPPPSPTASYDSPTPTPADFTKEPPSLPPALQLSLLNVPPVQDAFAALPRPQHVILEHLYLQRASSSTNAVIMGCTHRHQAKYVTTVLYKPRRRRAPVAPPGIAAGASTPRGGVPSLHPGVAGGGDVRVPHPSHGVPGARPASTAAGAALTGPPPYATAVDSRHYAAAAISTQGSVTAPGVPRAAAPDPAAVRMASAAHGYPHVQASTVRGSSATPPGIGDPRDVPAARAGGARVLPPDLLAVAAAAAAAQGPRPRPRSPSPGVGVGVTDLRSPSRESGPVLPPGNSGGF